jgi:hypothetical protein
MQILDQFSAPLSAAPSIFAAAVANSSHATAVRSQILVQRHYPRYNCSQVRL